MFKRSALILSIVLLTAIPANAETVTENHHLVSLTGLDAATITTMTMAEIGALIAARRAASQG